MNARLLSTIACAAWLAAPACSTGTRNSPASILDAAGPIITVQLLNASTTLAVTHADVTVHTDSGIECATAPCPRNDRQWQGTSDAFGVIRLPKDILQRDSHIATAGLNGDLVEDSAPAANGRWAVELLPLGPDETPATHPLKLIDARTGKPVTDSAVRIEFATYKGSNRSLELTSNALGYVFVPFDVIASAAGDTWLQVPGYRRTRADFAWVRRKTLLERR